MYRFLPPLILLTLVTATGCPIVITCEDTGCPSRQVCNEESGLCEDVARDCRDQPICRQGEVCDEETGECRPERLRCTESFTCPEGQSCNASSGFCEPAFRCETNDDCGTAEQCNPTTQACDPRECDTDDDCPVSYVCDSDDETCIAGCRLDDNGCSAQQFCSILPGEVIGTCEPNCRTDQDCPFGQICDLSDSENTTCTAEDSCSVDADCRVDEICSDTTCVQPPCQSDDDCLESQVCEIATRTCRSAECSEDNFGAGDVPNHTPTNAFTLDYGTYTQLVLCPGRSDWFALSARSTDIARIRLAQQSSDGDFDIYVYDEDLNELVSNQLVGPVSTLKLASGREQVLYIEVRSVGFAGGIYDLTLTDEVCVNDTFEENDELEEATVVPSAVGVPSELALRSCGFDEDWFRVRQNDPNTGLRIERVTSTADLRVDVFTPDGGQFPVGADTPFRALRGGTVGDVYVRAFGRLGQTGDYRLAFEVLDAWDCEGAGTRATPQQALITRSSEVHYEPLCPFEGAWEVDWLAIDVDATGVLDFALRSLGDAPALDVVLWAGDGVDNTLVRTAVIEDGVAYIQAAVDPSTDWFVRVSSPANVGRVLNQPGYEVEYVIR